MYPEGTARTSDSNSEKLAAFGSDWCARTAS